MAREGTGRTQVGSQTLARGIRALLAVAESPDGMTSQQLASHLGVHRSIAYRLLQTLANFQLVTQSDNLYRAGPRLATLADAYLPTLRELALPVMREVADQIGCTVSLFVANGAEAMSIALVEPTTVAHHVAFKAGMRTPINRGAAGYALLAAGPPSPGEPAEATLARERGYATSTGEVEPGAYGVAASIPRAKPCACLNIITYRADQAKAAEGHIVEAAKRVGDALSSE